MTSALQIAGGLYKEKYERFVTNNGFILKNHSFYTVLHFTQPDRLKNNHTGFH